MGARADRLLLDAMGAGISKRGYRGLQPDPSIAGGYRLAGFARSSADGVLGLVRPFLIDWTRPVARTYAMSSDPASLLSDLVRTGVPLAALVMSGVALWITNRLWVRSNRPIVSAFIQTSFSGNQSRGYDIVAVNSGSRPAVEVQLRVQDEDLLAALADGVESNPLHKVLREDVRRCFSSYGDIPLLLNNQTKTNSFGYTGPAGGRGTFWKPGASFEVTIAYRDLDKRSFKSTLPLHIRDSETFAGGAWGKSTPPA